MKNLYPQDSVMKNCFRITTVCPFSARQQMNAASQWKRWVSIRGKLVMHNPSQKCWNILGWNWRNAASQKCGNISDEESVFATTRDEEPLFEKHCSKNVQTFTNREPVFAGTCDEESLFARSPWWRNAASQKCRDISITQKVPTFWGILDRLRQKTFPPTSETRRRAYNAC